MTDQIVEFSQEQWEFLSVFDALAEPVSLDVAGVASPILPTPLFDVLRRSEEHGLLRQTGNGFLLSSTLPVGIKERFDRINSKERYSHLIDCLTDAGLFEQLSTDSRLKFIIRSGRGDAGGLEVNIARQALNNHQYDKAETFFEKALNGLSSNLGHASNQNIFIAAVLEFSDLCFGMGRRFLTSQQFLEQASAVARHLGDKRSEAMTKLHLGRLLYLGGRRHEAVELMEDAEKTINELGDEDIRIRAAECIALYYYMLGRHSDAISHFETAIQAFENQKGQASNVVAPFLYGYCCVYLGQFHKAIGYLDNEWRRAKRESNQMLAITVRSVLGTVLLLIDKQQDAIAHLQGAYNEAAENDNTLGKYLAGGGLSYGHYRNNDLKKAVERHNIRQQEFSNTGIVRQFSSPWVLEMLFDLQRSEYHYYDDDVYYDHMKRVLDDPSIHLRGIALRLIAENALMKLGEKSFTRKLNSLARQSLEKTEFEEGIEPERVLLKKSESYLKISGDPVQLAKTRIQLAHMELEKGNRTEARGLAQKARKGLSGFWEEYYPDGIRSLLDENPLIPVSEENRGMVSEELMQLLSDLVPSLDMDEFFSRVVSTMNRYFSAERGGLFWKEGEAATAPILRIARNLNESEVSTRSFQANMKIIKQSLKDGQPRIVQKKEALGKWGKIEALAVLCLPLKQLGNFCGVLYYDNSYLEDCFDFLEISTLEKLGELLNLHIDRMVLIEQQIRDAKETTLESSLGLDQSGDKQILYNSSLMSDIVAQIDRSAFSDSAVLIQGESGVGKELLAQRLHQMSPRRKKPFIIIDPTTIPENLVESELFGHEKGSFTGADRQKRGRIELADQGTLFIDEIGEIPKAVQAKLLRVLQEKTFSRVGGNQVLHSDFRLVAATNRNLAEEVNKGNFREDLFYRINIVPINPPPLRDRPEDILLLARHFLDRYTKKYHRLQLKLTSELERQLVGYHWPGNVRELINIIERSVILAQDDRLELNLSSDSALRLPDPFADMPSLDEVQKRYVQHVLNKTDGRITGKGGSAEILGMKPSTLYHRMKKLGILR